MIPVHHATASSAILSARAETPEDFARSLPTLPWSRTGLTAGLAILCVALAVVPGANEWLQFDRSALAEGQWWRIFTGHFTHWSAEHLAWDLLVFVALGLICEPANRPRFVIGLLASSLLIPLTLWVLVPGLQTYRGLSGLDTALFTLLAASALQTSWREGRWRWFIPSAVLLLGLVTKIGFEILTDSTMFVDASSAGFQPVPLAHVIGALVGTLLCLYPTSAVGETEPINFPDVCASR
jgi:rhomboid family GlyGly-CTERM serine protease